MTGSTVAIASASKASKKVATPTMIRVLTCHHEVGSRSSRATMLSTDDAWLGLALTMFPSPLFLRMMRWLCLVALPYVGNFSSRAALLKQMSFRTCSSSGTRSMKCAASSIDSKG